MYRMPYSKQFHVYQRVSFGGNVKNAYVPAYVPFRVKKVKFDFAYEMLNTSLPNIVVTSQLANGDVVGNMNKYALTGQLGAEITQANLLSAAVSNTLQLATGVPITVTRLAGGQLPADTTASISAANFNARAILTNADPMVMAGNLTVDFAYPALTAYVDDNQFAAAACTNNAGILNIANVLSGTVETGVTNVLTLSITQAQFAAALCNNANPSVMGNAAGMAVTVSAAGVLPQGTTGVISKATWDALNIDGTANPVILGPFEVLGITPTIPATTAHISVAQFTTANAPNTNNPVSIDNNCAVTLTNASGDNLTTLRLNTADFLAAGIMNRLYAASNIPITLLDTVGNSFPSSVTAYVTTANFNAAAIDKNNNPLTVGGAIAGSMSNSALTLSLTQANFNAANIANTNDPLTMGADIPITINGGANIPTYWFLDGFSEDKAFSYIFRDPIDVNQSVLFNFTDYNSATNTVIFANVVVHMEFLGD